MRFGFKAEVSLVRLTMQRTFLPPLRGIIGEMRTEETRCARYQDDSIRAQIFSSGQTLRLRLHCILQTFCVA